MYEIDKPHCFQLVPGIVKYAAKRFVCEEQFVTPTYVNAGNRILNERSIELGILSQRFFRPITVIFRCVQFRHSPAQCMEFGQKLFF